MGTTEYYINSNSMSAIKNLNKKMVIYRYQFIIICSETFCVVGVRVQGRHFFPISPPRLLTRCRISTKIALGLFLQEVYRIYNFSNKLLSLSIARLELLNNRIP